MYHELTKQEIRRRTRKRMAGLLAIVLVVMLVWLSSNAIGACCASKASCRCATPS